MVRRPTPDYNQTMTLSSRKWSILAVAFTWIAAGLAYSNSFTISFQFDDTHTVQSNVYIRSLSYIPRYFVDATTFSYRPENSGYRPMSTTACALAFWLSHQQTWGFHLIKLLEHCLVATFVFLLGLQLLPKSGVLSTVAGGRTLAAFFGALVFAVHRANTEIVDYITAISSLQAGLFYLVAFYLYLSFRRRSGERQRFAFLALSVACYLSSMLSKEEGITLPAMLVFYEWIYGRKNDETYFGRLIANAWRWTLLVLPYAAAALLFLVLRAKIQPSIADTSRGSILPFDYFITQWRSWFHYWALFFWPVSLNADNLSFDFSNTLVDVRVLAALAFHLAVFGVAWVYGKRRRFILFAVVWMYVTVLPASSIFPLVEAVNEHRAYIPYMLLTLLSSWLLFSGLVALGATRFFGGRGRALAVMVFSLFVFLLGAGTYARNEVWQTDISLWEDIYSKNPDSPRALNVLGISKLNHGELATAMPMLVRCHQLARTYLPCMVHLSIGYAQTREYQKGLEILKEAYSYDPNYPHVNFHLGLYYKDYLGDFREAITYLGHVKQLTGGRFFQATIKLAEIYLDDGDYDRSIQVSDSVLELDISNGDAWDVLGRARMFKGDLAGAQKI
ncbi:MAG: hypothetical protein HY074_14540, partial [Deltaproteobacteria bacterium]|nr:hypothetical protein [Deltaproteobacteria bacterium]